MRTPAELTDAFRARGLKVTPQRQLLFRLLHANTQHPTAEALFATASAEMPGISLRTVYQTLADLASMGELQQVTFGSGPTRFDPNVEEHHHVVCDRCGAVRDVWVDGVAELRMAPLDGFEPSVTEIVLHGRCAACAAAEHTPSTTQPTS